MTNGYLYIAFGKNYLREATRSAISLRNVSPFAKIAIISCENIKNNVFDKIIFKKNINKIEALTYTPFENTFFIDTDTYFCECCDAGFDLLKHYDICMADAPNEICLRTETGVIEGYKPLNSGVILYNKKSIYFFQEAANLYNFSDTSMPHKSKNPRKGDQFYISSALLTSNLRIHVLPSNWNFRTCFFVSLRGSVKIIHDRGKDMESLKIKINENLDQRCWNPIEKKIIKNKLNISFL